jgi:polysaccharide export outer membrane protein
MRIFQIVLIFFAALSLHSCVAPNKLYYFHDLKPTTLRMDSIDQGRLQRIQKSDRLSINVSSPEPLLTAFLNPFNAQNVGNSVQQFNNGYLVNDKGNIFFPYLGELKVEGLSSVEASKMIREKLSLYYKDIFVNVNIAGRVFFINGRQGTAIPMLNERLTIFEAMAQSGPQDAFDKKDEIWLVREENGQRSMNKLNLNSKDIFTSPYYYLKTNDLIYVQQGRSTTFLTPGSPARNVISITGAAVAVIIALNNIIR